MTNTFLVLANVFACGVTIIGALVAASITERHRPILLFIASACALMLAFIVQFILTDGFSP